MAHPTGFEPVASAFGGQRSIQLSYGCVERSLSDDDPKRQGGGARELLSRHGIAFRAVAVTSLAAAGSASKAA